MMIYRNKDTLNVRGHCAYTFSFYASSHFYQQNETDLPMIFTILVSIIFIATSMTFCMYDAFVRRRNAKVLDAAAESNAIISSLFPTNVRDRLFEDIKQKAKLTKKAKKTGQAAVKSQLKNMVTNGKTNSASKIDSDDLIFEGKPIGKDKFRTPVCNLSCRRLFIQPIFFQRQLFCLPTLLDSRPGVPVRASLLYWTLCVVSSFENNSP